MHKIEIGESMEFMVIMLKNEVLSPRQISEATKLPHEFVNDVIGKFKP